MYSYRTTVLAVYRQRSCGACLWLVDVWHILVSISPVETPQRLSPACRDQIRWHLQSRLSIRLRHEVMNRGDDAAREIGQLCGVSRTFEPCQPYCWA